MRNFFSQLVFKPNFVEIIFAIDSSKLYFGDKATEMKHNLKLHTLEKLSSLLKK